MDPSFLTCICSWNSASLIDSAASTSSDDDVTPPLLALASLNTITPAFSNTKRASWVKKRFAPSTIILNLGVTPSSLEVLAALSMSDAEFEEHMQVRKDGSIPDFYKRYVQQVQQKIEENALMEFECIWHENERSGTPRSVLTDVLSTKINGISEYITASKWTDDVIKYSLRQNIPSTLIDLVGIDNILKRVPQGYLNAIVGACLSSRYIYKYGISSSELSFYQFMHTLLTQPPKH